MKGDRFRIVNAEGKHVGYGYGHTHLAPGESRVELDTEEEMLAEPEVDKACRIANATHTVCACKGENRTQAMVMKAMVARMFLENVPDTGEVGDPYVIDSIQYRMLWMEYTRTHEKLDGMSPWDLARAIDAKAREVEDGEADRREMILEAEQTLIDEGAT